MRPFPLALLLGCAATCHTIAPADSPVPQPELEFSVLGSIQAAGQDSVSLTTVSEGEAVMEGVISTPSPCYEIGGELSEDGTALILTLTATAMPRICAQMVAAFRYAARIHHLGPGTYSLIVRHDYPGTGWESKRYRMKVEVP